METTDELVKELVIARLKSLPEDMGISVGSEGNFKKDELIMSVQNGGEIGQKIVEVEMDFLRSLKNGILYE
jgi:hypothetical protein